MEVLLNQTMRLIYLGLVQFQVLLIGGFYNEICPC